MTGAADTTANTDVGGAVATAGEAYLEGPAGPDPDAAAQIGPAVSEALAAANEADALGEQALQQSTVSLATASALRREASAADSEPVSLRGQEQQHITAPVATSIIMPEGSHPVDWSHGAQLQHISEAAQQVGEEQALQTGFGYLLTAPNLPAGMAYNQVDICFVAVAEGIYHLMGASGQQAKTECDSCTSVHGHALRLQKHRASNMWHVWQCVHAVRTCSAYMQCVHAVRTCWQTLVVP